MHAHELRSFEQAYAHEIAGAVSLYTTQAVEILEAMFREETGETSRMRPEARTQYEKQLQSLLVAGFRRKRVTAQLPTLHVTASCHAAVRWDKRRRLEGNDLLDFHHAAAALAYCDAFLTEKPLQVLLTSNPLALDKQLGCNVVSELPGAIGVLQL
jgi:hypothetical protein